MGQLKETGFAFFAGSRKSPAFVAEEFTLQQFRRQGGAVHGDEGAAAPRAGIVDALGEKLFAGAAFSLDEDRRIVVRHDFCRGDTALHGRIPGQDITEGVTGRETCPGQFIADIFFQAL